MSLGKFRALAVGLLAGVSLVMIPGGSPLAATSLVVTVTGGGTFSGSAATSVLSAGNLNVTCSTVGPEAASATSLAVPSKTYMGFAPVRIGTGSNLVFHNCAGPLGTASLTATTRHYAFDVVTTTASGATGVATGTLGMAASMPGCSFTVSGDLSGYYGDGNSIVSMGRQRPPPPPPARPLTVHNVSGCSGLVSDGQQATYTASYTLTPTTLNISSVSSS